MLVFENSGKILVDISNTKIVKNTGLKMAKNYKKTQILLGEFGNLCYTQTDAILLDYRVAKECFYFKVLI